MQDRGLEALDALEALLGRQADAIRRGDADALPALAEQLQQRLGLLAAGARGRSLPPAWRPRLLALMKRAQASQAMLVRRQVDVGRAIDALAAGLPSLKEMQARRVYAPSGTLGASSWRGGGFGRA